MRPSEVLEKNRQAIREATLFDLGGLHSACEALPKVTVDLVTLGDLPWMIRAQVLSAAKPR